MIEDLEHFWQCAIELAEFQHGRSIGAPVQQKHIDERLGKLLNAAMELSNQNDGPLPDFEQAKRIIKETERT